MMKTKKTTVAEPAPVYGRKGIARGFLVQYVVPAKDKSFVEDIAKVRGWEAVTAAPAAVKPAKAAKAQGAGRKTQAAKPSRRLSGLEKAIQEVERGEVFSADSVDDMFDQILGKGWLKQKKHNEEREYRPNACTIRAMEDARAGRVFHAKSPKDLIKQILG